MFDLTASLLVLLGFLIFRWAVIAAPILGTVGLLRPASAGLRRLANAVVAAVFNIAIFGTGAAIYLFAVDLIMSTATLPGWLQVVLVWLCGVVGWLLLRPYRRITQLGGKDSSEAISSAGSLAPSVLPGHARRPPGSTWPSRAAPPSRSAGGAGAGARAEQPRPEARREDPAHADGRAPAASTARRPRTAETAAGGSVGRQRPAPARRGPGAGQPAAWTEPDVPEETRVVRGLPARLRRATHREPTAPGCAPRPGDGDATGDASSCFTRALRSRLGIALRASPCSSSAWSGRPGWSPARPTRRTGLSRRPSQPITTVDPTRRRRRRRSPPSRRRHRVTRPGARTPRADRRPVHHGLAAPSRAHRRAVARRPAPLSTPELTEKLAGVDPAGCRPTRSPASRRSCRGPRPSSR